MSPGVVVGSLRRIAARKLRLRPRKRGAGQPSECARRA